MQHNARQAFVTIGVDVQADAIEFSGCCASCGSAMPAPRRSVLTQILLPEFRPDLAIQVIQRLEKHIEELEATLAEART
jgi:Fe-S cluster biogenesis protein NfuA